MTKDIEKSSQNKKKHCFFVCLISTDLLLPSLVNTSLSYQMKYGRFADITSNKLWQISPSICLANFKAFRKCLQK